MLKKHINEKELREILYNLLDFISIVGFNQEVIKRSLKSKHKDFEDAIQIIAAQSVNDLNCIITKNIKDFKDADITVLPPDFYK